MMSTSRRLSANTALVSAFNLQELQDMLADKIGRTEAMELVRYTC